MEKTKNIFHGIICSVIFTGVILLSSCRTELEVDVPEANRKIVLNSLIQNDSLFSANVYMSSHVQDADISLKTLNNVQLLLYEDNELIDTLKYVYDGFYKNTEKTASLNKEYRIEASRANLPTAIGTSEAIDRVPIISFDSIKSGSGQFGDDMIHLKVKFKDPQRTKNFYRLGVIKENSYGDSYRVYPESSDPVIEMSGYDGYLYFSDAFIDGDEYSIEIQIYSGDFDYGDSSGRFKARLENLTEDFYLYSKSVEAQSMIDDDFAIFSQAVIVYNNIENGFGIVGSTAISIVELETE